MNMKTRFCMGLLIGILVVGLAGCGGATETEAITRQGDIAVSGAWALYPMMVRWSEEYQAIYPGVQFDISAGGAGKGMADALARAVDIGMVSREIYPEEVSQGAFWVKVTRDAVVPTLNADNPYLERLQSQGMPRATLEAIWLGTITTWGEALGDPAITDEIHLYTRSDACGAAATWAAYLGDLKQEDLQGIAVYGDPGLASAVSDDLLGIGYNNLNFAYDADSGVPVAGLQVLPLDLDEDGQISAAEGFYTFKADLVTAIAEGVYPSPPARALNLVTQGQPSGATLDFINWVLIEGQSFVDETGYIQLTSGELTAELEKLP